MALFLKVSKRICGGSFRCNQMNELMEVVMYRILFTMIVISGLMAQDLYSQATTYEFDLAGYHMVPPVRTTASGTMEVTVQGDSLFVSGTFQELRGYYWSAYIHYGSPGETGNRLLRLRADLNDEKNGGELLKEKNSFELRPAIRQALRDGNLYMIISSNRNQDGEIRGQIPRM